MKPFKNLIIPRIFISLLVLIVLPNFAMGQIKTDNLFTAQVMYCSDGDTCRLQIKQGTKDHLWLNVRLAGIDAPETAKKRKKKPAQPFGEKAKAFINESLSKKKIKVRQVDLDHYNRPIVELYLDGKLFNLSLLENGLAEVYRGKSKRIDKALYQASEQSAKKAKRGIWSLKDYLSPKDYRKKR